MAIVADNVISMTRFIGTKQFNLITSEIARKKLT